MSVRWCSQCKFDWPPSFTVSDEALCPVCGGGTTIKLNRANTPDADARQFLLEHQPLRVASDDELAGILTPDEIAEYEAEWAEIDALALASGGAFGDAEIWLAIVEKRRRKC